jgi:hypothetical protein
MYTGKNISAFDAFTAHNERTTMKKQPDVITSDDIPELRADLCGYAGNDLLSDDFRLICIETIAAIDVATAEDAATHARLTAALERFVRAGNVERESC